MLSQARWTHVARPVSNVERSLEFYLALLGPLGWTEFVRYPTYRGTEEVVSDDDLVNVINVPGGGRTGTSA